MSEASIATAYVELRPRSNEAAFQTELRRIEAQVERDAKAFQARLQSRMSPSAARLAQRSGVTDQAVANYRLQRQTQLTSEATVKLERDQKRANETARAGRASFLLLGAGMFAAASAVGQLTEKLRVTGDEALTTSGRLRNLAADAANLNFEGVATGAGELAALQFQGGASQAQAASQAAAKALQERQTAIDLVGQQLQLEKELQTVTGQVGTAEGVRKVTLEAQLRAIKAQVAALSEGARGVAFGQFGLGPNGQPNQRLIARTALTPQQVDQRFELDQLRAQQTKSENDDLVLLKERKSYLRTLIANAESSGLVTDQAKQDLIGLYGKLDAADEQINRIKQDALQRSRERLQEQIQLAEIDIQIQSANARTDAQRVAALQASAALEGKVAQDKRLTVQERKQHELQAAQDNAQIASIQQQQRDEARRQAEEQARLRQQEIEENKQKLQRQKDAARQLRELRLGNAEAKAQLTQSTADDRRAIQASIRYWRERVKQLTGLEREQARSELISARGRLKGLSGSASSATVGDFFSQALQNFRSFGSNFGSLAGPNVLSPQAARGQFSALALGAANPRNVERALAQERTTNSKNQLAETKKQTGVLQGILIAVGGGKGVAEKGGKVGGPKVPVGSYESAMYGALYVNAE